MGPAALGRGTLRGGWLKDRWLRLALLMCLAASACVTNPATGRREMIFMTPQDEAEIGREESAKVAREMGIVDDPALTAYVTQVGQRVARQSPRQDVTYRFQIVDMPEPNAFALPGGYVYVSRGLLVIANSEDELANVIGHEIAHVAARHAASRQAKALPVGILTALGTLAAGVIGGGQAAQAVGQMGQTAGAGLIASYGRDQEHEADRLGQDYAARAGADPSSMSDFLRTLERATALERGERRRPSFLDTHPSTPERVALTESNARGLSFQAQPGVVESHEAFLRKLDGLVVGQDAEEGVVDGSRLLHPGLGFQIRFPEGWQIMNARSAVLAASPNREAALVLELDAPARTPRDAAGRFVQQNGLQVVEAGALQLGVLDGYRALAVLPAQRGPMAADLTWIAFRDQIYRLTGLSSGDGYRSWQGSFASVARSFRELTPKELASIREQRLRIVSAKGGETLERLVARTGSSWKAEEVAVANALPQNVRLTEGQLVKIALSEPFAGGTPAPASKRPAPAPAPRPKAPPAPATSKERPEGMEPL